jgi:hypothetical protein
MLIFKRLFEPKKLPPATNTTTEANNMKITTISSALFLAVSLAATNSHAAPTVYPNAGTVNPDLYSFTATSTGSVVAYFAGADAFYADTLSLLVNGVEVGTPVLSNQTSLYGDSVSFGNVNAGDKLVFRLNASNTGSQWFSDASLNMDGKNHVYSSSYGGDEIIPAGVFISFEDVDAKTSDFDYNDASFVVTNTSVGAVPVPAAAWLFGSGLLGLAGVARRRSAV